MRHYTITTAKHSRRRTDSLRRINHYWEVVTEAEGVVGAYGKTDFVQATKDAAMLRNGCASVCDVRRAV